MKHVVSVASSKENVTHQTHLRPQVLAFDSAEAAPPTAKRHLMDVPTLNVFVSSCVELVKWEGGDA